MTGQSPTISTPGALLLVALLTVQILSGAVLPGYAQTPAASASGPAVPAPATEDQRMDIFGDIMYLNQDGTRVVEGHLVIEREGMKLWGDRGTYNEKKQYSTATGNVKVLMDDTVLTCGYLEYFMAENKSIARINPKIVRKFIEETGSAESGEAEDGSGKEKPAPREQKEKPAPQEKTAIMVGREIEIFHDENRVKSIGNAIVTQYVDSSRGGPTGSGGTRTTAGTGGKGIGSKRPDPKGELKVTAESIEIFTDINRLVAVRNVKIVNNDITAVGNKAVYSDNDGILDILGNARTWQNANLESPAGKADGKEKTGDGKSPEPASGQKTDGKAASAETASGSKSGEDSGTAPKPAAEGSNEEPGSMVHINDLEGGHAEAERAVYNAREEVLDLIGSAKSWQEDGINLAQGDRIRYFLKDKRSVIIDARIKHYPGSEGDPGQAKKQTGPKKKAPGADKTRKSAEEAALEALRALD